MIHREDPRRFISYYENQAGGALPGFSGSPMMYGRGVGSIFSKLFRFVSPLVKRGFAIAKPHLKSAASNIASDVMKEAVGRMTQPRQEGSGGIMVLSRRRRKRPPGGRVTHKRATKRKGKSVARDGIKKRKSSPDIF